MGFFKEFDVCLNIAVPHDSLGERYSKLMKRYEEEGIKTCLWLLLPFEAGYWPSERNVNEFSDYLDEVYEWAAGEDLRVPWIGVDLETPIYQLYQIRKKPLLEKIPKVLEVGLSNLNEERFEEAVEKYNSVLEKMHDHDSRALTAVDPAVINDGVMSSDFIQDLLETPIFGVEWDKVSFMIYTSMWTGYSQGLISREESTYLLYDYLKDAKELLNDRAAVSVGVTGIGMLGDEPYYEKPNQLKPDIEAALAAGVRDISVYSIEGLLRRGNPREWFKMIRESREREPNPSWKADLVRSGIMMGSSLGSRILR